MKLQFQMTRQSTLFLAQGLRRIALGKAKSKVREWTLSAPGLDGQAAKVTFRILLDA